jgi:uncharacterized Tic20 family protein
MEAYEKLKMSDHTAATSSTIGMIATSIFWILSMVTPSLVATIVTVIAGVSTIVLNIQRYRINKKNKSNE